MYSFISRHTLSQARSKISTVMSKTKYSDYSGFKKVLDEAKNIMVLTGKWNICRYINKTYWKGFM